MLLLRSASLPLLNSSWVAAPKEAAAREVPVGEGELVVPLLPRAPSLAHLITPFGVSPSASSPPARRRLVPRAMSGADQSPSFRGPPLASRGLPSSLDMKEVIEAEDEAPHSSSPSSSTSSELDGSGVAAAAEAVSVGVVSDARTGGGDGGRRTCNGGRGRRGSGGGGGGAENDGSGGLNPSDSNHGNDATGAYHLQMMKADPGNSLILGNYAKFLKDVRGRRGQSAGVLRAGDPGDAGVLALYADLVWETSRDAPRAETYFRRAVQAAPGDCYILASYARVLWDAEEEEETEGGTESRNQSPTAPPIAAAS